MKVPEACADPARTKRQKRCSGPRKNQTDSTSQGLGLSQDMASSAQWSLPMRGKVTEDGD